MTTKTKRFFVLDHQQPEFIEGNITTSLDWHKEVEDYVNDYMPEKGETITVYELVPVATYKVTAGFERES